MKIVVAMDSFKGSLDAPTACRAVERGLQSARPDVECIIKPMADGGEGTAAALMACRDGIWIPGEVTGPLPDMRADAGYAWFIDDQTAVVEMAVASGLTLVPSGRMNPMKTTTYGTGELLRAAAEQGAKKILLAVGGSATVDGGTGAAAALGWHFLDENGEEAPPGGQGLASICRIVEPEWGHGPRVEVLCDVDNPLTGPEGAAAVYGPQKGATPEMVESLDAGLKNLADIVRRQYGLDIDAVPGAGAAGGLSAGAMAFMGARLVPGIDTVMTASGLKEALKDADWIITGEGRFDDQSLRGKVVAGVTRLAREAGVKIAVLAGSMRIAEEAYRAAGVDIARGTEDPGMPLEQALACAEKSLVKTASIIATELESGR